MSSQLDQIDSSQATQQYEEKQWVLKDGIQMKVGNYYKKTTEDKFRTLDLVFRFEGDPNPKIVELPYTKEALANALMICNTELETFLFLEECPRKDQSRKFEDFIHQATEDYKDVLQSQGSSAPKRKRSQQYKKPTIVEIEDELYLVCSDIFVIGPPTVKLSELEVLDLPVIICYNGPDLEFETDVKTCYSLLSEMFCKFNLMQNKKFVSFPIAAFTYHMVGQFYPFIIKRHGTCSMQMSISGSATSTGKSLLQSCGMLMFHGEEQPTMSNISETTTHEMLSSGCIYVKEFCSKRQPAKSNAIDTRFLERCIKTTWEGASKGVKGKMSKPIGVVFIDANILPSTVFKDLDGPTFDKIGFNYTGPDSLEHDNESELVETILKSSRDVYKFLPVLLSLGASTVLKKVTSELAKGLGEVLKKKGDLREGQRILSYDLMYTHMKEAFMLFCLPLPLVFQSDGIDRTSLTYFNTCEEDIAVMEDTVKLLLEEIPADQLFHLFEHSKRTSSFQFRRPDLADLSAPLVSRLKVLKTTPRPFKGQKLRVIVFPEAVLKQTTIQQLLGLGCTYEEWVETSINDSEEIDQEYGEQFYQAVEKDSTMNELPFVSEDENMTETGAMEMEVDDELMKQEEETELDGFMCEKLTCKDYRKVFKYASQKRNHEK